MLNALKGRLTLITLAVFIATFVFNLLLSNHFFNPFFILLIVAANAFYLHFRDWRRQITRYRNGAHVRIRYPNRIVVTSPRTLDATRLWDDIEKGTIRHSDAISLSDITAFSYDTTVIFPQIPEQESRAAELPDLASTDLLTSEYGEELYDLKPISQRYLPAIFQPEFDMRQGNRQKRGRQKRL